MWTSRLSPLVLALNSTTPVPFAPSPSVSSRFTLSDKILDDVCAYQKDETVVRTVESPLALLEDMDGVIDALRLRRLLVLHSYGIESFFGRRTLHLTFMYIISKGFPSKLKGSGSQKKKLFHRRKVSIPASTC